MSPALLDTSILLDHSALPVDDYAISSVSLAELHFGALAAKDEIVRGSRMTRVAWIENTFDALPFDSIVAREYGRLAAAVKSRGGSPRSRAFDLAIAATANVHGIELITLDQADLEIVDDLVRIRR